MKKIYFVLAAVAMFFAVEANAQITVGAGYNHGVMTGREDNVTESEGFDGFYIEATYDWNFLDRNWGMLAIQPGVRFSYMGDAESEKEMGIKAKSSFNETYLDVPVLVKYSYPLGKVKLSAFAGPVFSLGLTSTTKASVTGEGMDYMTKVNMYSGKMVVKGGGESSSMESETSTDYGRFDLKLGLGIGATLSDRFNVKLGYNFGLLNRYTGEKVEGYRHSIHTGIFYVGVGYSF